MIQRLFASAFAVMLLAACSADFKSGATVCAAAEPRCPEGFTCSNNVCFRMGDPIPDSGVAMGGAGGGGLGGKGGAGLGGTSGAGGAGVGGSAMGGTGAGGAKGGAGGAGGAGQGGMGGMTAMGGMGGATTCDPPKKSCPALDDAPPTCGPGDGVCSTVTICGTTITGCKSAGDLVQCNEPGLPCKPLATTCPVSMLDMTDPDFPCSKCIFRKCCALVAACAAIKCTDTMTMPQFGDLTKCVADFCTDSCK
jgi:hypothetical protein